MLTCCVLVECKSVTIVSIQRAWLSVHPPEAESISVMSSLRSDGMSGNGSVWTTTQSSVIRTLRIVCLSSS